MDKMLK